MLMDCLQAYKLQRCFPPSIWLMHISLWLTSLVAYQVSRIIWMDLSSTATLLYQHEYDQHLAAVFQTHRDSAQWQKISLRKTLMCFLVSAITANYIIPDQEPTNAVLKTPPPLLISGFSLLILKVSVQLCNSYVPDVCQWQCQWQGYIYMDPCSTKHFKTSKKNFLWTFKHLAFLTRNIEKVISCRIRSSCLCVGNWKMEDWPVDLSLFTTRWSPDVNNTAQHKRH